MQKQNPLKIKELKVKLGKDYTKKVLDHLINDLLQKRVEALEK